MTVTGVDDTLDDGNIGYSIVTAAATSGDPNYAGVNAGDVSVTNTDDDASGITVEPDPGLTPPRRPPAPPPSRSCSTPSRPRM